MSQLFYTCFRYLREDFKNNFLPVFLSLVIIGFSLFVVALFLFIKGNLDIAASSFQARLEARIFLKQDAGKEEVEKLKTRLKALPAVKRFEFLDREKVKRDFERMFPSFSELLKSLENPFPPTFVIHFRENASADEVNSALEELLSLSYVDDVVYERKVVERILGIVKLIKIGGFFLQVVLLFSALLIIANVIGLNIYSRKEEIYLLQIVGASRSFIGLPFMFQGFVMGLTGGIMALLLFSASFLLMKAYAGASWQIISGFLKKSFLSGNDALYILIAGTLVGLVASTISVGRYLIWNK